MSSTARGLAVILGLGYVLVGLVGFFVTGFGDFFSPQGSTLILFPVNPAHNLVHIAVGAVWLISAVYLQQPGAIEGVNLGIGLFYVLAAVVGFAAGIGLLAIPSGADADNFLHLATGVIGIAAGSMREPVTA